VVGLLVLEAAGQLLVRIKPDWLRPPALWDRADALAGEPWVDAYFKEWWNSYQVAWEPYAYWRRLPHDGEYIHVGEDGLRRTWTPSASDGAAPPAARVYMFGGSTLWGFGARDDHTIPSCLARALAEHPGPPVAVSNLAETGYVSTQGVLTLLRRLQHGDVPDLVVFYDGINDIFSTYQAGEAGLTQNEHRRRKEFNLLGEHSGRTPYLAGAAAYHLLKETAIYRWTESLVRMASPPVLPGSFAPPLEDADCARLAADTAAVYLANVRILHALAEQFGFQVLCFWQPMLFDKPTLTAYEAGQAEAFGYLEDLVTRTTDAVRAGRDPSLQDTLLLLSNTFDGVSEPLFLDFCHVAEGGNAMLAAAMLEPVRERLQRMHPPRQSPGSGSLP
jgi:lysophospholipase L1-like esterase